MFATQPIKFTTQKLLPVNAHYLFRVVQDVDSYSQFIKFMSSSFVLASTRHTTATATHIRGGFDAKTTIGFQLVNFEYLSRITYTHPLVPVHASKAGQVWQLETVSPETSIFKQLRSDWLIKNTSADECLVDYSISLEFASPLYAAVTRQFFDLLVSA